jgi:hypothetical protein
MAKWIALKARVDCPECGQPVFLEGPWADMRCPSCHATSPVGEIWDYLVSFAAEEAPRGKRFKLGSVRNLNWPVPTVDYAVKVNQPPVCECGNVLDAVSQIQSGTDSTFHCPQCGAVHETFPAPKHVHGVAQVFLARREDQQGTTETAPDAKPVIFSCPQCSASLKIHSEHRRIVTCEFCDSDVFLPAELWHRLHPVRRRRAFWFRSR